MNARRCMGVASLARHSTHARIPSVLVARSQFARAQTTSALREDLPNTQQASTSRTTARTPKAKPSEPDNEEDAGKKKPLQKPRNEAIAAKFAFVRFVNPTTGTLDPPSRVQDLLRLLNRKKEYLELVADKPEPIVKIINTAQQYDRKKQRRANHAQNRAPDEKEMQLTWGVANGDLHAKLNKVRDELLDGNRVTLVFAPKKGQPLPKPADQMAIVEETVRLLADVGRERHERSVQPRMVGIFLESLRARKQVHELVWAYDGDEPWVGLKAVETGLRKGARVDVSFSLLPPTRKLAKDNGTDPCPPARIPEINEIRQQFDKTMADLTVLGNEWRPRDTRRNAVVVHLEGIRVT